MSMKGKLAVLVVLAMLVAVLSGCAQKPAAEQKPEQKPAEENVVRIGFIWPLTGDVKTFGESSKNGSLLALEEANYKAGKWTIKYEIQDDRNDATEAVNVATKLISDFKANVIIGGLTSKCAIPISELCEQSKVVMMSNTATNPKVTYDPERGGRKTYVFRACFIDDWQGEVGAKFALQNLKAKTAAVLYDQGNDYVKGLATFFKQAFEAGGGKIVAFEAYTEKDTDFSAVLTKIKKENPDVLYLPDYYNKVSLIAKQARDKGIKAVFMGGDGWDSSELDFAACDGGYFTNHYSPEDPRPEVQEWVKKYQAKYGSVPDALATLAYEGTRLVLKAIEIADSNDPTKIRDALQNMKGVPGVSTPSFSFDDHGNPVKPLAILQIKDGKQKFIAIVQR